MSEADAQEPQPVYRRVRLDRVRPMPNQPRRHFAPAALAALGLSLKQTGQRTPILVYPVKGDPRADYELIDGERRWRAAVAAGLKTLKAELIDEPDAERRFLLAVTANFSRIGHDPMEEARAFGRLARTMSHEAIAAAVGLSKGLVAQRISLLNLVPDVAEMLGPTVPKDQRLPVMHAVTIASLPPDQQREAAGRIQALRVEGRTMGRAAEMVVTHLPRPKREGRHAGPRAPTAKDHGRTLKNRVRACLDDLEAVPEDRLRCIARGRTEHAKEIPKLLERLIARATAVLEEFRRHRPGA